MTRSISTGVNQRYFVVICLMLFFPTVSFGRKCAYQNPDEFIKSRDLIFKGKVIDYQRFLLNIPIADDKTETLLNVLKEISTPEEFSKSYEKYFHDPSLLREGIENHVKYKMITSFKGPALEVINVTIRGRPAIGEEKMIFAGGNLIEGYSSGFCAGYPYYATQNDVNLEYQAALDQYRREREQFADQLNVSPRNVGLLRRQAGFFFRYRDLGEVEAAYRELAWHYPHDPSGFIGLANVALNRGVDVYQVDKRKNLFEQALKGYRDVLQYDSSNRAARHGETLALLYLERWPELMWDSRNRDFSDYQNYNGESIAFFAGNQLVGAKFRNAKLYGFDFSNADLRGADFSGAEIGNCNFSNAKLDGAVFRRANIQNNNRFAGATLRRANFDSATFKQVDFSYANLYRANFINAEDCYYYKSTWPAGFSRKTSGMKSCEGK
ncbi:pentapeptide repeat-containing protein [Methylomonas sp. SURF-1]|uniref:Pentapeptide repeat-containing protein n=1 Tax=Methylomonas aurea TaxID=2952224 RepID=A0ABT1UED0_9GAMM|nr:pentapeptide repeat-containing protein [Methylomonas sp. SURF-1]MCQ8180592.1 pentapeptide repeat-containing protein [Methylomonas sp. SURF-1]